MQTLKNIIEAMKIRKGPAHGTTKRGAFWTPSKDRYIACLRWTGGDGIGQSSPDVHFYLEIRHFRSGEMRAIVVRDAYHQNGEYAGAGKSVTDVTPVLDAQTAEDALVVLKGIRTQSGESVVDVGKDLVAVLVGLGLPDAMPAPDEVN